MQQFFSKAYESPKTVKSPLQQSKLASPVRITKFKSNMNVRKESQHKGRLIFGRRKFSVETNPLNEPVKTNREKQGSTQGSSGLKQKESTILELIESKGDMSTPNQTIGTRSLGPWKDKPAANLNQIRIETNQTILTQESNEFNLQPTGINIIAPKREESRKTGLL